MRTIKEWQRAAYQLAVEKGWHSRECEACDGEGYTLGPCAYSDGTIADGEVDCEQCERTGRVPIDPHTPTRIASRLALIHCEISEAVERVARGRMELYWNGGHPVPVGHERINSARLAAGAKPEGFGVELADVFLRLCDLAESLGLEVDYGFTPHAFALLCGPEETAAALNELHFYVARIDPTEDIRAQTLCNFSLAFATLHDVALGTGVDLLAMAELKHAFNKTRPLRHGGKRI